ncbi:MAG: MCP four helix bundle domain-containing protein, partial [Chloroflexota bacterium]
MRLSVQGKLLGLSAILIAFMVAIGLLAIVNLGAANATGESMYKDRLVPIEQLGKAEVALGNMRRFGDKGIAYIADAATQATLDTQMADAEQVLDENIAAYAASFLLPEEKDALAKFQENYAAYQPLRDDIRTKTKAGDADGARATQGVAKPLVEGASADLESMMKINVDEAGRLQESMTSSFESSRLITIVVLLFAAILGFALSFWLARRITGGVRKVQETLAMLSDKDATWLAEGMERLKENDLTYPITPATPLIDQYGTDEIGKTAEYTNTMRNKVVAAVEAYNAAREGLSATITVVQETAESVTRTSEQLNEAASQTGAA